MGDLKEKNIRTPFPERVQEAVNTWFTYTENIRELRKRMLASYANKFFDGGKGKQVQQVNLIDRGVQIIAPYLVMHNPRITVRPRYGANNNNLRAFCNTLELALTHLFNEIKLSKLTLRPAVIDSLFLMGIVKTGTMHSHFAEVGGYLHQVGQPFCDKIDFDDYIGYVPARNRAEMKIEGHKYRLPEEYVKTSGLFKNYDSLKAELDLYSSTKPENVGKPNMINWNFNELRPTVELIDLWLPDENIIITIPPKGYGTKIMRTVDWDGPEGGPFDILAYRYFPNSIIPIPPVYTWLDINNSINALLQTMTEQAKREKSLIFYEQGEEEAAERARNAADGGMIGVQNVDALKEMSLGGFSDKALPYVQFLMNEYSKTGPNLDITGGRTVMANTLGQEQIMQANAQRELDDMVREVYSFTEAISRKLAWFLWSDPLIIIPMVKRVAGVDIEVEYSEATKEGDYFDYSFEIEPYSLSSLNPEMRYQRLMQLISQVILPTAQIAASQGNILQIDPMVRDAAKYLGVSNIDDWWKSAVPSNAALNPYQPLQGTPKQKNGQQDGRTGMLGAASRNANLQQQQTRTGGAQSTKGV